MDEEPFDENDRILSLESIALVRSFLQDMTEQERVNFIAEILDEKSHRDATYIVYVLAELGSTLIHHWRESLLITGVRDEDIPTEERLLDGIVEAITFAE